MNTFRIYFAHSTVRTYKEKRKKRREGKMRKGEIKTRFHNKQQLHVNMYVSISKGQAGGQAGRQARRYEGRYRGRYGGREGA